MSVHNERRAAQIAAAPPAGARGLLASGLPHAGAEPRAASTVAAIKTIGSIQALRGIAATAVVLHHSVRAFTVYDAAGAGRPLLFAAPAFSQTFAAGVDIFFVISGFIMSYISAPYRGGSKSPWDFLSRRLIRIYPMYLLATFIAVAFLLIHLRTDGARPFDLNVVRILDSAAFVPTLNRAGEMQPVLGVGWTLYYEMYFYGMLTVALAAFRRNAVMMLAIALTATCAAVNLLGVLGWTLGAIGAFLRSTLIFDFILGLAIGEAFVRGLLPRTHPVLPIAAGVAGMAIFWRLPQPNLECLQWGIPSALVVIGFLLWDRRRKSPWPPSAMTFGDASYVIYLFHTIVIYELMLVMLRRLHLLQRSGVWLDGYIALFVVTAVSGALFIHLRVERPLTYWLRRGYQTLVVRWVPTRATAT